MKATGIVRRLDKLGRLCLPMELRRQMKIGNEDCVEFFMEGDSIVIRKFDAAGDLLQILEGTERSIRLQEYMAPEKTGALLIKLEEMKAIAAGGKA
jgi:transcriptional pleiotropic regulator of transition state genes